MRFRHGLYGLAIIILSAPGVAWSQTTRPAAEDVQYYAVFMGGKKVGHGTHARAVESGKVTTADSMSLTINRAGMALTVQQKETNVETADGEPLSFSSVQDLGIMASQVDGTVSPERVISAVLNSGGTKQTRTVGWPAGALMAEGLRLLEIAKGLKEGTTYPIKMFVSSSLSAWPGEVRIGPTRNVDLLGRVVPLTEIVTAVKSPTGEVVTTSYIDKDHRTQKTVMPMLGINVEVVACSRQVALSKTEVVDFFDKLVLPAPAPLDRPGAIKAVTYHLQPAENATLHIPATDTQTVKAGPDGQVLVTVRPAAPARPAAFPYQGKDPAALAALKPTRFLQCDDPAVVALARKAVGDAKDALQAVRRIEQFVRGYIDKKSLSVGYASASEVAAARQGDCSEHAVLAAAMCRAVGIPAQVVCGMAYVDQFGQRKNIFGPHAWVQALAGERWMGLDAALDGFDAGHVALAAGDGNPEDFFGFVSTLGYFKIVKMDVER